jgi:hypothetical protein
LKKAFSSFFFKKKIVLGLGCCLEQGRRCWLQNAFGTRSSRVLLCWRISNLGGGGKGMKSWFLMSFFFNVLFFLFLLQSLHRVEVSARGVLSIARTFQASSPKGFSGMILQGTTLWTSDGPSVKLIDTLTSNVIKVRKWFFFFFFFGLFSRPLLQGVAHSFCVHQLLEHDSRVQRALSLCRLARPHFDLGRQDQKQHQKPHSRQQGDSIFAGNWRKFGACWSGRQIAGARPQLCENRNENTVKS